MSSSYWAITDSTSILILLNSSRQLHAPVYTNPENSFAIILYSIWSLQLMTIQKMPQALAKSLVLSVFPVPAGPAGAAPSLICMAPVIVIQHLSVNGVMTKREVGPIYSYP